MRALVARATGSADSWPSRNARDHVKMSPENRTSKPCSTPVSATSKRVLVKRSTPRVTTLIGDVVGSRAVPDRAALHGHLTSVLAEANRRLQPVVPLRVTVGDEYQGCFATPGEALHATLWMGLHLAPRAEAR